jgi:oxaloacetate decarboxylase alpha subunit
LITKTFEDYYEEIKDLARSEEDVLSYALFPDTTRAYLERHKDDLEKTVFMTGKELKAVREGEMNLDIEEVKELIKALEESQVDEIVIEGDGVKLTLRRGQLEVASPSGPVQEAGAEPAEPKPPEAEREVAVKDYPDSWKEIVSPMVGTFYRAPSPDAPPYVEEGDVIEPGQPVCILEAMKLFNEVAAEEKGIIRRICVENAQSVEYGQLLFLYEPVSE